MKFVILFFIFLFMSGCGSAVEIKTDMKPVSKRFPFLGKFIDCQWTGGTVGNSRLSGIGPNAVFFRGYVRLDTDGVKKLNEYSWSKIAIVNFKFDHTKFSKLRGWESSKELNDYVNKNTKGGKYMGKFFYNPKEALVYFDYIID